MTKTTNYQLNQWDPTDRVLRTDFNSDNQKIDAALGEIVGNALRIAYGTYDGTGGSFYNGNTIQNIVIGFTPKVVFIAQSCYIADGSGAFITLENPLIYDASNQEYVYGQLRDAGFTVGTAYVSGNTLYPDLNTLHKTYHYLAIG